MLNFEDCIARGSSITFFYGKYNEINNNVHFHVFANFKSQIDEVMNFLEFKNLEEIKSNLKNPLSKEGILEMEKFYP